MSSRVLFVALLLVGSLTSLAYSLHVGQKVVSPGNGMEYELHAQLWPTPEAEAAPSEPALLVTNTHTRMMKLRARAAAAVQGEGDWVAGKEVGSGGNGKVYAAKAKVGGADVAIKTIECDTGSRPWTSCSAAAAEHKLMVDANKACPDSFPAVHDMWLKDIHPRGKMMYIVMELLHPVPMAVKGSAPTPDQRVAAWGPQLVTAVNCLHALKVVHRDLKLSNVMLTADHSKLKIIDLGAAEPLATWDGSYGTDAYANKGDHVANSAAGSEGYQVGVVIFELAFGVPVFEERVFGFYSKHATFRKLITDAGGKKFVGTDARKFVEGQGGVLKEDYWTLLSALITKAKDLSNCGIGASVALVVAPSHVVSSDVVAPALSSGGVSKKGKSAPKSDPLTYEKKKGTSDYLLGSDGNHYYVEHLDPQGKPALKFDVKNGYAYFPDGEIDLR